MANKIYKNKKILYVCFEVNRKNIINFNFCVVIVNAWMKWLENIVKTCLLLTIFLHLESFVETGVRDLENGLFF